MLMFRPDFLYLSDLEIQWKHCFFRGCTRAFYANFQICLCSGSRNASLHWYLVNWSFVV